MRIGLSSAMNFAIFLPLPSRNFPFNLSFRRSIAFGDTFIFVFFSTVVEYPGNLRFQGRATALFSSFTFSFKRSSRNSLIEVITLSPDTFDLTYMLQSSAYRQKECSLPVSYTHLRA